MAIVLIGSHPSGRPRQRPAGRWSQLLVFSTSQPVIFVMMFRYVLGGAITVPAEVP
jgi:hypothetical protein